MEDPPASVFRAIKRRRLFRQRDQSVSPPPDESASPDPQQLDTDARVPSRSVHTARHKVPRRRAGGIEFTSSAQLPNETDCDANDSTERHKNSEDQHEVGKRFAPQTGQIADVDKHM